MPVGHCLVNNRYTTHGKHRGTLLRQLPAADILEGTKEQLQAFGLGLDQAWPTENGGPEYDLQVRDPLRRAVTINTAFDAGKFSACISFQDYPPSPEDIRDRRAWDAWEDACWTLPRPSLPQPLRARQPPKPKQ